jgi:ATP-binding cassette subfamily B multidrug efflux pump
MSKAFIFLKPYRLHMGIALFLMLVELIVELLHPLFMSKIIDDGIMKEDVGVVLVWGGIMMGMSFVAFAAGVINSFYAAHVSQSYGYDVRKGLFEKVQSFSFANFNLFPTSSLITRLTNDITMLQNTIFMGLRIMLRAPLLVIGGMAMAFYVNAKLAFILVLVTPILFIFLLYVLKKGSVYFRIVQQKLDGVNKVMRENLTGMRLIKAFLRKDHEISRFSNANKELKDQTVTALRLMELTMPLLLLLMNLGILGVLWFGRVEIFSSRASVGDVVAVVNYALRMTAAFSILSWIIMAITRARASANRISEVLQTEVDVIDMEELDPSLQIKEGKIQFNEVSFKYPGSDELILKRISFHAQPGETIAILGATGSGKSSLFQLVPRLYDLNEGEILIDNIDLRRMSLDAVRKQIGFVPQDSLLFTGTVKENIAWGKENASMTEIREAALHAQIHETIDNLPDKYQTVLGQKGVNLSGGQKQRLSIARALVRKPTILLLDDSTSALDLKTEAKLLDSLKNYNCTTLIITQKISTAMEADKILLLEDGKLLTEGDHVSLLEDSVLYQQIYQSQFGEERLQYVQRNS